MVEATMGEDSMTEEKLRRGQPKPKRAVVIEENNHDQREQPRCKEPQKNKSNRLKRTTPLIVGKNPVRIAHALGIKNLCIYGSMCLLSV